MSRSRMLILFGILLLVGVLAVLVLLPQTLAPTPTPVPPTPVPEIPTREILVAAQNVPRGQIIKRDAIAPAQWPEDSLAPLG